MTKELKDKYYQGEAKRIVDMMFDNNLFNKELSRDDMQSVEDLIAYYFDSSAYTARKAAEIMIRVKKDTPKAN